MSSKADPVAAVPFNHRARLLLTTALITVSLSTAALAQEMRYLQVPDGTGPIESEWRSNSNFWNTARDGSGNSGSLGSTNTGVLVALSSGRTVTLRVRNEIAVSVLEVESNGYQLLSGQGNNNVLVGAGGASGQELRFNVARDTSVALGVNVGGVLVVGGEGRVDYSASGPSNNGDGPPMTGFRVESSAELNSTGRTRGDGVNSGLLNIRAEARHTGSLTNQGTARTVVAGTVTGTVVNGESENDRSTLTLNNGLIEGTVTNASRSTMNGNGEISGGTLNNFGRLNVRSTGQNSSDTLILRNMLNTASGVIEIASGAILSIGQSSTTRGTINVNGRLDMRSGQTLTNENPAGDTIATLTVNEQGIVRGSVDNRNGARLRVNANGRIEGNVSNSGGATTDVAGEITQQLTNEGGTVNVAQGGSVGTLLNAGTATIGQGGTAGQVTNSGGTLAVNGTVTGMTTVSGGVVTINDTGRTGSVRTTGSGAELNIERNAVTGALTSNSGTTTVRGRIGGDATNSNGGRLNLATGGQIDGSLTNNVNGVADVVGRIAGSVRNEGQTTIGNGTANNMSQATRVGGDYVNARDATTTLRGYTRVEGNFTNDGTILGQDASNTYLDVGRTFTHNGQIIGNALSTSQAIYITAAQIVFGSNSRVSGNVLLNGAVVNGGSLVIDTDQPLVGDMTNHMGGQVLVNANLDGAGYDIRNRGSFEISGTGQVNNLDRFDNEAGSFTVRAGGSFAGNELNNSRGADIRNGGTITAAVNNAGTLTSSGTINGALLNDTTGVADLGGRVNGTVTNNGRLSTRGPLTITRLINGGTANVLDGQRMTVSSGTTNTGTINISGTLASQVSNNFAGTLSFNGGRLEGTVSNTGRIEGSGTLDGVLNNRERGRVVIGSNQSLVVTGLTTNEGLLDLSGQFSGAVNNLGTTALSGGTLTGAVENSGAFGGDGVVAGTFLNTVNGTLGAGRGQVLTLAQGATNNGTVALTGGTIVGAVTNNGTIGGTGRLETRVGNTAGGTIAALSGDQLDLAGGVDNSGRIRVAGWLAGPIANLASGRLLMEGGTYDGALRNSGLVQGSGTISQVLTNATGGTVELRAGDRLSLTAGLANGAGSALRFLGGALTGRVENHGLVSGGGRLDGTLVNFADGRVEIAATDRLTLTQTMGNQGAVALAGTIAGSIANSGAAGAIDFAQGTLDGSLANGARVGGAGTITGDVLNRQGGTFTMTGRVGGLFENNGTLAPAGALTVDGLRNNSLTRIDRGMTLSAVDGVENRTDAILTVNGTLSRAPEAQGTQAPDGPLVVNSGRIDGTGTIAGLVSNLSDGLVAMSGSVQGIINRGEVRIAAATRLAVADGILNHGTTQVSGTLAGAVENRGRLVSTGTIGGAVSNTQGATADLSGRVTGVVANAGTVNIRNAATLRGLANQAGSTTNVTQGATLTATSGVENRGTLDLRGTLNGGLSILDAGRTILRGGTINGDVSLRNANGLTLVGTAANRIEGTLENRSATTFNSGNLTATRIVNRDALSIGGTSQIAVTGTLDNLGRYTQTGNLAGHLVNHTDATATLGNGAVVSGNVTNAGEFAVRQEATITGTLENVGRLGMDNGDVTGRLTVGGLSGTGHYGLDVDLSNMTADRIRVAGGAATGNYYFTFNELGASSVSHIGQSVTVLQVDGAHRNDYGYSFDPISISSNRIVYDLVRQGNGDLALTSGPNPAVGALLGNIALTHSLIGSVINRPSSPYVVGMAYEDKEKPCGVGSWGRALGGTATATGATDNGTSRYNSEVKANYYGMQVGTDLACFNGTFDGWDMAFGALLGVNQGKTDQPNYLGRGDIRRLDSITKTDFNQIYGGVYMTATKDRWSVDLQYRYERTNFDIDNRAVSGEGLGLADKSFDSRANTISGSVSYTMPVGEQGWQFVPSAGFAWSKIDIDRIHFTDGYTLDFDSDQRKVGFLGGTITKTFVKPETNSALNVFATGTYYKDFSSPTHSTFTPADGILEPQHLKSDNLGAYTELSLGANWVKVLEGGSYRPRQLSAGVRLDGRYGSSLESVGLTGQVRLQF